MSESVAEGDAVSKPAHYIDHPYAGGSLELVRLEPQPTVPKQYQKWIRWYEEVAVSDSRYPDDGVVDEWTLPQPGDVLAYREEWYCDNVYVIGGHRPLEEGDRHDLYYRSDGTCCKQIPECSCAEVGPVEWRPPHELPDWAIRTRRRIVAVEVKRLKDASEDELPIASQRWWTHDLEPDDWYAFLRTEDY